MLNPRTILLAACSVVMSCLFLALAAGATVQAGDKKDKDKKAKKKDEEPKVLASLLKKEDELTDKDEKDTKRTDAACKVYKIKLEEGKVYQIDMKVKDKDQDLDPYLRLEDPAGKEVAFDDDGGGFPNARIMYKAPKAGEYKIIATSFNSKFGKFTLTVVESAGITAASIFKAKPLELKWKDGKASYTGELEASDAVALKHHYKLFTVNLEEGKTYQIDHRSKDFDAYLFLEDPAGAKLAEDDDSGGGLDSRIVYKAAKTGDYRIIATTLPPGQKGKFSLEVIIVVEPAKKDKEKEKKTTGRIEPRIIDAVTIAPALSARLDRAE